MPIRMVSSIRPTYRPSPSPMIPVWTPAVRPVIRGSSFARRSSSHSFCSMCQSAGCSAMPAASRSAICWVSACTRASSGAGLGRRHRDRPFQPTRGVRRRRTRGRRRTAARRFAARAAPGRPASGCAPPKKSTSTPRADRSRSASSGTTWAMRSRSSSTSSGGRSPPAVGMISMPSDSRYATNRR